MLLKLVKTFLVNGGFYTSIPVASTHLVPVQ